MLSASGNLGSTPSMRRPVRVKSVFLFPPYKGLLRSSRAASVAILPSALFFWGLQSPDFGSFKGSALQNPGRWLRAWRHASESVHASRKVRDVRWRCPSFADGSADES